ncbi:MAG TPA: outer membrane protein assembly factor BamD [Bacteroidales bacterium]|nr:outer membrane protein assembly factor BamD [Bacteroidales bacterium]
MFKLGYIIIILTLALGQSGCSSYQRLLRSDNFEEKYQMAMVFFEQKDYSRAIQLFDIVQPYFRGTDRAEILAFYYAYAHYHQRDYILASFYFDRFSRTFPRSERAKEAAFMSAYCKYLDSPRHNLDQTTTLEAIQALELFINMYPTSPKVEECNRLIDSLRDKLEQKDVDKARLYFRMGSYISAITAFQHVLKTFPDTKYREEIMFDLFRAHYFFASRSIAEKKDERIANAMAAYDNFIAQFPESNLQRDAAQLQKSLLNQ